MKRIVITITLFLLFSLVGCKRPFDDSVPRDKIISYVNKNHEKLEMFANDEIPKEQQMKKDFIKEQLGSNTIVKNVYVKNENIIKFYCGGSGLVTGSTDSGFYYSKDDTPYGFEFDNEELTEIKPGVFEWQNEDGTHKIHTEKIRDNWYYYIMDYY